MISEHWCPCVQHRCQSGCLLLLPISAISEFNINAVAVAQLAGLLKARYPNATLFESKVRLHSSDPSGKAPLVSPGVMNGRGHHQAQSPFWLT